MLGSQSCHQSRFSRLVARSHSQHNSCQDPVISRSFVRSRSQQNSAASDAATASVSISLSAEFWPGHHQKNLLRSNPRRQHRSKALDRSSMANENEPPQPTAASPAPEPAQKLAKVDISSALRVKKLSEHAVLPTRGSQHAAGYDLSR